MKKFVILKPNCHELANHLWNYLSIYAYGLETNTPVQNPSFFEWHTYFSLIQKESLLTKIFSSVPALGSVWRAAGALYGSFLVRARASCVLLTLSLITYLPPTTRSTVKPSTCDTTYFIGWLFRNPLGLGRHRNRLVTAFIPKESVLSEIANALAPFSGKHLIGIHLRQKPFKGFEDEPFTVPAARVRAIVDEYVREKKLDTKDVALIIVSDEEINLDVCKGYAARQSHGDTVTNLFLLSRCSVVIGTNSSFSNLAAWFGNVPHIVESHEPLDWEYYKDATTYFDNTYATFAF